MAVTSGYFNSVNGDRKYNADQMSEYFEGIINEGVCQHIDGGLAVTAGTGLSVSVAAGKAFIGQKWIRNDAALTLTIGAASTSYARIDAVVVRRNNSTRTCEIAVKSGTPAASPEAPSMTRTDATYEMALAYVNVAANATSVTVTDKRSDSTVCGWATVAQSTSGEVDQMLNDMKTGFDGVTYSSPAAMVQGEDQKINDNVNSLMNIVKVLSYDLSNTLTKNGYIINNVVTVDSGWRYSDYIEIENGIAYIKFTLYGFYYNNSKVQNITFYDANKTYISDVGAPTDVTSFQKTFSGVADVPDGAKYIVICTKASDIERNSTSIYASMKDISDTLFGTNEVIDNSVMFVNNGYIFNDDLTQTDNGWRYSNYIKLPENVSVINYNLFGFNYSGTIVKNITFYDEIMSPISSVYNSASSQTMISGSVKPPMNAVYIRTCTKYSNLTESKVKYSFASNEEKIERISNKNIYSLHDAFIAWSSGKKFPVAFAGDSTTDGYGTTGHVDNVLGTDHNEAAAYPAILETLLKEETNNSNIRVYNAGFSGQSITYLLDNFDAEFGQNSAYSDVKMIGISFGINDRPFTPAKYAAFVNNLYRFCDMCFARGIQPFMLTSQCTVESANGVDPNRCEWKTMSYANKAKYEVAEKLGLELIDVSSFTAHYIEFSNKPLFQIMHDLCHFGDNGHKFEAGMFFANMIPRVIHVNKPRTVECVTQGIKSEVVFADGNNYRLSVLSNVQNGFKTKIESTTSIFENDIVLIDAWIFIDGDGPLTLSAYCDNVNTTHVLVDGVNTVLTSTQEELATLDLGLHHIVAKSGTSRTVQFYGFKLA